MAKLEGSAISLEELKRVLTSLKNQRETIINEYKSNITKVLETSHDCISVSGLDMYAVTSAFDSTFNALEQNFDALIQVLENDIIKNYSDLSMAIQNLFSAQFAAKLSELLGIK